MSGKSEAKLFFNCLFLNTYFLAPHPTFITIASQQDIVYPISFILDALIHKNVSLTDFHLCILRYRSCVVRVGELILFRNLYIHSTAYLYKIYTVCLPVKFSQHFALYTDVPTATAYLRHSCVHTHVLFLWFDFVQTVSSLVCITGYDYN